MGRFSESAEEEAETGIDKQVLVRVRLRNRQVIATEIARTRLRAAVVVSVRMAKRAVRRSVKKSLQPINRSTVLKLMWSAST